MPDLILENSTDGVDPTEGEIIGNVPEIAPMEEPHPVEETQEKSEPESEPEPTSEISKEETIKIEEPVEEKTVEIKPVEIKPAEEKQATVEEPEPIHKEEPTVQKEEPVDKNGMTPTIRAYLMGLLVKANAAVQTRKQKNLKKLLTLFDTMPKVQNNDVEKFLHLKDAMATRYLNMLLKDGKIRREGTGSATRYYKI